VENEIKTKENLSRARKEVDNLQARRNALEEELYQSQTAKEKLEQILKKQDTNYLDTTNRALKAEGQVTRLQEELDRLVTNAKKTATQLETAQRAENVMGTQITNLRGKVQNLEGDATHHECQIEDQRNEIGDLSNKLKEVQGHREYLQRQYTGLAKDLVSTQDELANTKVLLDQARMGHQQREANSAQEIERLRSEMAAARQLSADTIGNL